MGKDYAKMWDPTKPEESARKIIDAGAPVGVYYYGKNYAVELEGTHILLGSFKTLREAVQFSRKNEK